LVIGIWSFLINPVSPSHFDSWLLNPLRPPLVMGVLNVTPDSFSDGGQYADADAAVEHGLEMATAGADLIDIGGESTRPGADPVFDDEQIRRVVPVIQRLAKEIPDTALSIDTTRSSVAIAALDAGAHIVNDISAGTDDSQMFSLIARRRAPIILMHMLGRPKTMQLAPAYDDVTAEVSGFLNEQIINAGIHGIDVDRILIDPGIGFGKKVEHNLTLLRRLMELTVLGRPLVVGTSRKSFIGKITGESEPSGRLFGTAASVAWCVANGARIVRVHDVEPMAKVVRMISAILGE
jgi:dihydropteroate synthase